MSVYDEYVECVKELERCVKHLKEFNIKLRDIGCRSISADSIFGIEEATEQLQHELENKIKKENIDEEI